MEIFLAVLFYAFVFTLILSVWIERERSYAGIAFIFFLIFLPLWTLAIFVPPIGPLYAGVAWFDIFIMALLLILFVGAATPRHYYYERRYLIKNKNSQILNNEDKKLTRGISIFFWVLVLLLLATILMGYR